MFQSYIMELYSVQGFDLSHKKILLRFFTHVQYIIWMILCRYSFTVFYTWMLIIQSLFTLLWTLIRCPDEERKRAEDVGRTSSIIFNVAGRPKFRSNNNKERTMICRRHDTFLMRWRRILFKRDDHTPQKYFLFFKCYLHIYYLK